MLDEHLDREALEYLIRHELHDADKGITSPVLEKGTVALSEKQLAVFQRDVVEKWLYRECVGCGCEAKQENLIGY